MIGLFPANVFSDIAAFNINKNSAKFELLCVSLQMERTKVANSFEVVERALQLKHCISCPKFFI